ncbi:hypothetical protein [Nesterenkonia sp. HG001]|uniref:endonuclease domain-containing protein n=1 Tax=Nesterenkonia sp. HG001 TaxID=2983207 RepID=UPI002AC6644A|nr:hypothetical protein [Nesterenkonia sp. HG001]MDZ5076917.1 endonuclease domain-containing protein [Nesterenkonia sp. HG001]
MPRRSPRRHRLPEPLLSSAFTRAQAVAMGVDERRLTYDDVVPLGAGVYAATELVERTPPERRHHLVARALMSERPEAWISDSTAAQLRGLDLPRHLAMDRRVHLTQRPSPDTRVERTGVVGHRRAVRDRDVVEFDGVSVSSAARNWLELAEVCSHRELVVLGDQFVRRPYERYEGRFEPFTTMDELHEVVETTRRVRGRRTARLALHDVRVGADSPPETLLRLALVEAGLPEPELQVPANPDSPWSPRADLGYPEWRIAIQYEGKTHYDADQHRRDQRRDTIFRAAGWEVLHVNGEDLRTDFRAVVAAVAEALRRRRSLI